MAAPRAWPPRGQGTAQPGAEAPRRKPCAEALKDLFETTAVVPSDIDAKAIKFLEALEAEGRAEAAIAHVKASVEEITREKIKNWPRYIFALLRKNEKDAYEKMHATRSKPDPRRDVMKKHAPEFIPKLNANAPEFVPKLNIKAPEFVPGVQWMGMN